MFTSNQQTLAESGASDRPPILEKGSYVPWTSQFRRFLDNKQEEGEQMWRSIEIRPYVRKMITDPEKPNETILEPISKMTKANKKQYFVDIKVMNYILQGISSDIYNSVDACKDAKKMWERIKRLMHGPKITKQERHSRLMNEFDKFVAMEGEPLVSVYERMTTLWSKYVTLTRQKYNLTDIDYDVLYVIDYEDDYQGELQGDAQEDKLTTAMMNQTMIQDGRVDIQSKNVGYARNGNRNAGRQNINQAANTGNGLVQQIDENDQNVQRVLRTESNTGKANVQCYNFNAKGHCARNFPKPKVCDAKIRVILVQDIDYQLRSISGFIGEYGRLVVFDEDEDEGLMYICECGFDDEKDLKYRPEGK
ncbi:hypothetical protein Tco_1001928 [Tanacetum coccineum]|uniref:Gag protein n=1 Tax=Tanacetum coccineum TaxID=301880 RepID=A0ABQ5F679_9ASTR